MSKPVSLQDMISRAIHSGMEKSASDKGATEKKVRELVAYEKQEHGHIPTPAEEAAEKTASARIDDDYVEKLASSCDWIALNFDKIDFPVPGILEKAANEHESKVGPGRGPGSLEVDKSIGGEQSHKKDKSKTHDAAASEASSPLSTGGLPGSKTQMENDYSHAPGGGGIKPTGSYPDKGPLVAGPSVKHASPLAAAIMKKLAGEDVMKANIDGGGTSSPLAGMGGLTTTDASQSSPSQAGDPVSGYGNQGRRLIQSNQAAIDATKADAKGPQKTQLKEVLEEPALSPSTDSTLEENLRNTGKAGVKIAGARAFLEKVAAAGCTCRTINGECPTCRLQVKLAAVAKGRESVKQANAMMGMGGMGAGGMSGGSSPSPMMSSMATAGAGADGCTCAGAGECKVCQLKAALAAMKGQMAGGSPQDAANPVEKDSNMGCAPAGGVY
jgi:hypothetical protein